MAFVHVNGFGSEGLSSDHFFTCPDYSGTNPVLAAGALVGRFQVDR